MNAHPAPSASALLLGTALALLSPRPSVAQADTGTFVILSEGRTVGAERFAIGPDGDGTKATSTVSYLLTPLLALEVSVVYHSGQSAFQLDRRSGETRGQVYAVQHRNRVTVRRVAPDGEQASELPGGPDVVLLADSVFGPFLRLIPLSANGPRSVKALFPESGRRVTFRIERQPAPARGGSLVRLTGGLDGEILLGGGDEVLRIILPSLGLEARRDSR